MKYLKSISTQLMICFWVITGCNRESMDKDVKKELAMKAKTELNYAGLQYTIAEGVITLGGRCPTEKVKKEA